MNKYDNADFAKRADRARLRLAGAPIKKTPDGTPEFLGRALRSADLKEWVDAL